MYILQTNIKVGEALLRKWLKKTNAEFQFVEEHNHHLPMLLHRA